MAKRLKQALLVSLATSLLVSLASLAEARIIKISWDANTEPELAGYKVAWSTNIQDFYDGNTPQIVVDVGNQTWYCLEIGDQDGYIGGLAYDANGNVSGWTIVPILYGDIDGPCSYTGTGFEEAIIFTGDLNLVSAHFGEVVTHRYLDCQTGFAIDCALDKSDAQRADLNKDGVVDILDLFWVSSPSRWMKTLPVFAPPGI